MKNKKYVLIDITDNECILDQIQNDKIIDTHIMSEEMVDKIGNPIIYNP